MSDQTPSKNARRDKKQRRYDKPELKKYGSLKHLTKINQGSIPGDGTPLGTVMQVN